MLDRADLIGMKVYLEVEVDKCPTNDVNDRSWMPSPEYVAAEITHAIAGKNLDTGWRIITCEPSKRVQELEEELNRMSWNYADWA